MIKLGFQNGNGFTKTKEYFKRLALFGKKYIDLNRYGMEGVAALASATPKDTSETADSWHYRIGHSKNGMSLEFYNSNTVGRGIPVAILLQYGHATKDGCWIEGRDYINPAIQPVFDRMAKEIWYEVAGL